MNNKIFSKKYFTDKRNLDNIIKIKPMFTSNINNIIDINIIDNNNNNKNNNKLIDKIADFLTDEYQLITLSKINFLINKNKSKKGGFKNSNDKKELNLNILIENLKQKIIPVPNDITFNDYIYQFYQYYNLFDIFENKKSVLLIKPISKLNVFNKNVYLYNTLEEYLKNKGKNVLTMFNNYQNINFKNNETKNFDKLNYKIINNTLEKRESKTKKNKYELIYIKFFDISLTVKDLNNKKKELINLNYLIENLDIGLNRIEKGGDLLIELSFLPKTKVFIQLLYYILTFFDSIEFIKDELYKNDINMGIFLFKNYNNNFGSNIEDEWLINLKKSEYLKSLYNKDDYSKVDKNFKIYIKNLYKDLENMNKKHEEEKVFFIKELKRSTSSWSRFLTNHIIKNCIDWCKKNNIQINSMYNNFEDNLPNNLKFSLFPKEKGVNLNKIQLTYESTFSVTRPKESDRISRIIKTFYPKAKTIIDCTANIGGNTIDFAKHFKNVISIEIDPKTNEALKNNVKLYGRDNVKIILGDYTELKNKLKGDVYFFDPPWGGIFYRMHNNLDMYLSDINIIDLLPENFIMKAPINYNIEGLMKKFGNIVIYYITNFILIVNMTEKMKIEDTTEIIELLEDYKPLSDNQIAEYEDKQYEGLYDFFNTIININK